MKPDLAQLLEKIDLFYKMAGLLQVPEQALKEASDWVIAQYCADMAERYADMLAANKQREKRSDTLEPLLRKWQSIDYKMSDLKYQLKIDPQYNVTALEKTLDDLITEIGEAATLPVFDKDHQSDLTGLSGAIKSGNCMLLQLKKLKGGKYYYNFFIDFTAPEPKEGERAGRVTKKFGRSELSGATLEETANFLASMEIYVDTVVNHFDYFRMSYDIFSKESLKNMIVVYGTCKRLASQGGSEPTSKGKNISIKSLDLPYLREDQKDQTVTIGVNFITSEEEAKEIHPESWAGLWEESYNKVTKLNERTIQYIGTIYVKGDPKGDSKSISGLSGLNKELTKLKETTRHEMQHFVQTFIQYVNRFSHMAKNKEEGGLPGKNLRDTAYRSSGKPNKGFIGPQHDIVDKNSPHGLIQHSLRDVEFYTRLSDTVGQFNRAKTFIPTQLWRDYMMAWIDHLAISEFRSRAQKYFEQKAAIDLNLKAKGVISDGESYRLAESYMYRAYPAFSALHTGREFFNWLKTYQTPKYNKAVAEFMKAVGL